MYKGKSGINFMMLLRLLGWLLMIECVFMLIPLVTCLCYGESDWQSFAVSIGITAASGFSLTLLLRPSRTDMGKREGFLLTAMVWLVFSLFGMLPFMLSSMHYSVTDSFFEAMSGFTTTGASTIPTLEGMSHGHVIWRSVMQWIGGLGIILFTLAVIPMLNQSGGMQMFNAEVTGITHEKIRPRVSQTAKGLWCVYIILTVILFLLLWVGPMDIFESICHSFSVMSTGGISTSDESIGYWDSPYTKIVVTLFMFIGGVNFALIFRAGHGDIRGVWKNGVLRVYVILIAIMSLVIIACLLWTGTWTTVEELLIDPVFEVVAMMTSTGYCLEPMAGWSPFIMMLLFVLMFFGGCAGSTSGGAKIDRFIVLMEHARNEIFRCIHPNAIMSVRANGKIVSRELISKSVTFLCLYVMIIIAGAIVLIGLGVRIDHAFVATFASISNACIVTPALDIDMTFIGLPMAAKWILAFVMLVGRLELYTVLLLFLPDFWRK